jgi:hypothetical protein
LEHSNTFSLDLCGVGDRVKNAHFAKEKHGYGVSKRTKSVRKCWILEKRIHTQGYREAQDAIAQIDRRPVNRRKAPKKEKYL